MAERVGMCLGSVFCLLQGARTAKLRWFPKCGIGFGKRLLSTCTRVSQDWGYLSMQLLNQEDREVARALCRTHGWRCLSSKPVHRFDVDLLEWAQEVTFLGQMGLALAEPSRYSAPQCRHSSVG